ncbi:MAG: cytidine deaminase [Verrucomicrobiota bacterium]|nr:cytidine deaminase [Chthoniobacterales bacterium]MDQ3415392.1 cytidine deaminase [Verrucomicrobiota bacterium]
MGSQIDWSALVAQAWAVRQQAYAPYSKFAVGAALLTDSGDVFTGCNVENASFGLTICAERVAVTAAVAAGSRKFAGIALVADTAEPVLPCGACRQFLAEFNPQLEIYCSGRDRHQVFVLPDLLPSPFSGLQEGLR